MEIQIIREEKARDVFVHIKNAKSDAKSKSILC